MKKILVTGGTGYIGSHTAVELLCKGYEVLIVDNLSNSEAWVAERIKTITGKDLLLEVFDLCDRKQTSRFFEKHGPVDAVIHFAASKAVGESVKNPLAYYRNNIVSLLNVIDAMAASGCKNLVFSSSCTVYGQPEKLPVTEDAPLQPAVSPYGNTKQICEEIIRDTAFAGNHLEAISLRYFNPIGAHHTGLIGELPRGVPENLVPYITQTAIGLREELKVFGNDYDTPDGSCVRDYLHVTDLAKAHVAAVKRLLASENRNAYEVFNLGTGKGVSVLEAIASFEKVSGVKLNWKVTGRREGDIEKIWADPTLANRELGWKTEITVDEAMLSAWKWEQKIREKKHE